MEAGLLLLNNTCTCTFMDWGILCKSGPTMDTCSYRLTPMKPTAGAGGLGGGATSYLLTRRMGRPSGWLTYLSLSYSQLALTSQNCHPLPFVPRGGWRNRGFYTFYGYLHAEAKPAAGRPAACLLGRPLRLLTRLAATLPAGQHM